jgi:hypothetical protein
VTDARAFVRRNRVDERNAIAIALVAGVVAVFSGAEPTGATVIDWLLVVASVAAVVWAAASAPWWAPAGAAGIAAAIAFQPILIAIGAVAFVGGLFIGVRQRDQSELRALVAAIAMNVLIRSELDGFFGLSAIIGVVVGAVLFVVGLRRRPSAIRRTGWIATATVGGVAILALLATGVSALSVRSDISRANDQARRAVDVLNTGDYEQAAALFGDASRAFASVDRGLGGALGIPSQLLPGVAQNVNAGADLAEAAALGTADAADALQSIDASTLQVVNGAIDLEAISAVEAPLLQVQDALADLRVASESVRSPWLVAPVQDALVELDERLDKNEPRLVNAIDAVRLSPQMLGADGVRRYLVLFSTPVEARGIAGFIGNYADVTIDDGRIAVTEFGRRSDLEDFILTNGATCDGLSQEFLARYGRFGCTAGAGGTVIPTVWSNLTMPAHFPHVAEAASLLYPQSGGQPLDGVISIDPYVVQALMGYTGPVEIPELGVTVAPEDAVEFILLDQYVLLGEQSNAERVDALQTLGEGVIDALLTGSLPEPSTLARDLGPLAGEHRLMVWAADPDEREFLDRVNMLGSMPPLGESGGFSVVVANKGESKIDVFLERDVELRVATGEGGERTLVADVTLTNNAPNSGLPSYVIGNGVDLPDGSSSLIVNFFGPPTLQAVTRDGEVIPVGVLPEAGWMGYSTDVVLGSGESVDYHLEFDLGVGQSSDSPVETPVEWVQPLADRPT